LSGNSPRLDGVFRGKARGLRLGGSRVESPVSQPAQAVGRFD
jgi:hypothetical protein